MAILQLPTALPGQVGINPVTKKMVVTNTLAQLTTPGFLNFGNLEGFTVSANDIIEVVYNADPVTKVGTFTLCTVTIANSVITLVEDVSEGNVILPVNNGHFAVFSGTTGAIADNGYLPSDATKAKVVMANGAVVSGNLPFFVDVNGTLGDSTLASNKVLTSSFANPDINANIVRFDTVVSAAALAGAHSVTLFAGSATKSYIILNMWMNLQGVNFSGGGGDRALLITDSSSVADYSLIPATSVQTLANRAWGVTAFPFSGGFNVSTATPAGAGLVIAYSGGTADYAAGSVTISGLLQRVA